MRCPAAKAHPEKEEDREETREKTALPRSPHSSILLSLHCAGVCSYTSISLAAVAACSGGVLAGGVGTVAPSL